MSDCEKGAVAVIVGIIILYFILKWIGVPG